MKQEWPITDWRGHDCPSCPFVHGVVSSAVGIIQFFSKVNGVAHWCRPAVGPKPPQRLVSDNRTSNQGALGGWDRWVKGTGISKPIAASIH